MVATHCEEEEIVQRNRTAYVERFGEDPPITYHPLIRSREACIASSKKAIALAEDSEQSYISSTSPPRKR